MGCAVTIGCLIIDSGDRLVGTSESAGGLEDLDDSLRPEVLTLLAGGRCIELSRCEIVAPGVVGGLLISYLRRGAGAEGPMSSPPSERGIRGASVA